MPFPPEILNRSRCVRQPDTVSYLIRQGARVAEVPVIMDERILGVSYLTPVNAMRYMLKMLISILLIQNFRKRR